MIFNWFKKEKNINKDKNVFNENGYNKIYDENGTYQIGYNVNGHQHGLWQIFDEYGLLLEEQNFKNGLMHGMIRIFNDDGVLKNEINFKDGESNGLLKVYYPNGKVAEEGNLIVDNKKDGLWKYFFEDGTLQHEGYFKNAVQNGIWKHFHENGILKFEGSYKNGEKDGFWKSYDSHAKIINECYIKEGKEYSKIDMPEDYKETPDEKILELLGMYNDIHSKMEAQEYNLVIKNCTKLINILKNLSECNPIDGVHAYGDADGVSFSIVDIYYIRGSARSATLNNDALIDFNNVLDLDPDHIEARYNRSVFYYNINKDTQSALNDIVICIDLKPGDNDFKKFHEQLLSLYLESISEKVFIKLYKLYYEICFHYTQIVSIEENEVITEFFDKKFNKFYKNNEGVDWSNIKTFENGVEMVKLNIDLENGGTSKEFIIDILSLNIYHKNILTSLLIDIACANNNIRKDTFNTSYTINKLV